MTLYARAPSPAMVRLPGLHVGGCLRQGFVPAGHVRVVGEHVDGEGDHAGDLRHVLVVDLVPVVAGAVVVGEAVGDGESVRGDAERGEGRVVAEGEVAVAVARVFLHPDSGRRARRLQGIDQGGIIEAGQVRGADAWDLVV